jgi:putative flavoprotein involved in K+ transport
MTETLNRTDAAVAVTTWLAEFESALASGDADAAAELFREDCYWRDLVAFTWNIVTVEGRTGVRAMLADTLERVRPHDLRIADDLGEATEGDGVVESWIKFETSVGRCLGHLRLRDGKAWTLLTTMTELIGHEEQQGESRPKGAEHGANPNRRTWLEQRQAEAEELGRTTQPHTLVIGGGQGGIALGARLRQLGVPTIVIERNARAGDSWRGRYKSLCLHDPVWYDHLPYLDFPKNWPVFSPKDKIGDWLEMYVRVM